MTELEVIETKSGLQFFTRPDSTDQKVVTEVVEKHLYDHRFMKSGYFFGIEPGEHWLDLGGNIGTFAVWAADKGAIVTSFEPEPINCEILARNAELNKKRIKENGGKVSVVNAACLFNHTGLVKLNMADPNKNDYWRHSVIKAKPGEQIAVRSIPFYTAVALAGESDVCIKMDIEGAEMEILDSAEFEGIKKLVFEYHFDVQPKIKLFNDRMKRLAEYFPNVMHKKMPEGVEDYKFFPPAAIVYCWK